MRSLPLTLGASLNWTPSYTTRLSDVQSATTGSKLVVDASALWTFSPSARLRLSATNLTAADYQTGSSYEIDTAPLNVAQLETAQTTARSYVNWQLRLELKL